MANHQATLQCLYAYFLGDCPVAKFGVEIHVFHFHINLFFTLALLHRGVFASASPVSPSVRP